MSNFITKPCFFTHKISAIPTGHNCQLLESFKKIKVTQILIQSAVGTQFFNLMSLQFFIKASQLPWVLQCEETAFNLRRKLKNIRSDWTRTLHVKHITLHVCNSGKTLTFVLIDPEMLRKITLWLKQKESPNAITTFHYVTLVSFKMFVFLWCFPSHDYVSEFNIYMEMTFHSSCRMNF